MDKSTSLECGRCSKCCRVGEVACMYLTPTGCGVYSQRPESCRLFHCALIPSLPVHWQLFLLKTAHADVVVEGYRRCRMLKEEAYHEDQD